MKLLATVVTIAALAASGLAWAEAPERRASTTAARASAQEQLAQIRALEQQDQARFRVCDAQRAENPATGMIDLTPAGRRCLVGALEQAASFQGTLVLLRNASVALYKNPTDSTLRKAAMQAVATARELLVNTQPWRLEQFREQATALDLAEFSIHLPHVHQEQQSWRMEAFWRVGKTPRPD